MVFYLPTHRRKLRKTGAVIKWFWFLLTIRKLKPTIGKRKQSTWMAQIHFDDYSVLSLEHGYFDLWPSICILEVTFNAIRYIEI